MQALTLQAHPSVYRNLYNEEDEGYIDREGQIEAKEYDAIDEEEEKERESLPKELRYSESTKNTSTGETFFHPQTKTALPELCQLPEDKGTCFGEELAWRFDSEARDCVTFMYSGCKHNANYFTSEEACQRACGRFRDAPVCTQPKQAGHCHQKVSRWFYNQDKKTCELFLWSGCGGNGNRFSSKAECLHLCSTEIKVTPNTQDVCHLERDTGPCIDALTQWYFDKDTSDCKKFTYGGCRGNGNRFNSRSECESQCMPRSENMKLHHEKTCKLPSESGPCEGSEIKWFFDESDEECRTFTYSGCGGNDNRFDSEEACVNACRPHRRSITLTETKIISPIVKLSNPGPFVAGGTVEMDCLLEAGDKSEFAWFKNNIELEPEMMGQKFKFSSNNEKLTITNIQKEDSGKYACAAGKMGILSEGEEIVVKGEL